MYAEHDRFRDTQRSVPALVSGLGATPAEHTRLVLEHPPDGSFAQVPEFGDLRDRIVLFIGQIDGSWKIARSAEF